MIYSVGEVCREKVTRIRVKCKSLNTNTTKEELL